MMTDVVDAGTVTLLERITSQLPGLRRSEQKVAKVVLADPAVSVQHTMAALAQAASVSEPTVMRFCSSIGCGSFQEFRIQLAQTVALGLPVTHSALSADDGATNIAEKIFDHTISSLDRARRNLDGAAIERAVELVLPARELLFIGFGASGIIAQDAQQKWPLFGVACQAPADYHQQFIAATLGGPDSVTVAISNTGSTAETLSIARAAHRSGSPVIAIVGQESPLSESADVALVARTFEDTDVYTPSTSRLAGLVLIDILATSVAMRRSPEHREMVHRMKNELAVMRRAGRATERA